MVPEKSTPKQKGSAKEKLQTFPLLCHRSWLQGSLPQHPFPVFNLILLESFQIIWKDVYGSTHVILLLNVWKNYFGSHFCHIDSDLYKGYERVYYHSIIPDTISHYWEVKWSWKQSGFILNMFSQFQLKTTAKYKKAFSNLWEIYYFLVTTCSLLASTKSQLISEEMVKTRSRLWTAFIYLNLFCTDTQNRRRAGGWKGGNWIPQTSWRGSPDDKWEPTLVLLAHATGLGSYNVFLIFLFPEQHWECGDKKRE